MPGLGVHPAALPFGDEPEIAAAHAAAQHRVTEQQTGIHARQLVVGIDLRIERVEGACIAGGIRRIGEPEESVPQALATGLKGRLDVGRDIELIAVRGFSNRVAGEIEHVVGLYRSAIRLGQGEQPRRATRCALADIAVDVSTIGYGEDSTFCLYRGAVGGVIRRYSAVVEDSTGRRPIGDSKPQMDELARYWAVP